MRPTPLISAALLATIAAAAPAQAATVSPAGVRFPQIAVNAKGATVVAWERRTKAAFAVEVRSGATAAKLGRTTRLAGRGYSPRVAIGADGTRAVMWLRARGARRRAHGARRGRAARSSLRQGAAPRPAPREHGDGRRRGPAHGPRRRGLQRASNRLGYALATRDRAFGKAARPHDDRLDQRRDSLALDPRDGAVVVAYGTPVSSAPPTNQQAGVRTLATTRPPSRRKRSSPIRRGFGVRPVVVAGSGATGVAYNQSGPSLRIARRKADGTGLRPSSSRARPTARTSSPSACGRRSGRRARARHLDDQHASPAAAARSASRRWRASPRPAAVRRPRPTITPAKATFGATAVASAGNEAFLATAKAGGPVVLVHALRRRRVPARAGAARVQDRRRRPAGGRGQARPRRLAEG